MHKLFVPVSAMLALFVGATQAQVQKMPPQQDKMALCEKAAAGKTGNDRKSFLNSCMTSQSVSTQSVAVKSSVSRGESKAMGGYGCEHAGRAEDL